jgi:tRNA A-37 threonylcarbamoyl transferase component Bud32
MKGFSGDPAYRLGNEFVKETDGDPKRLLHQAWKQRKYESRLLLSDLFNIFKVPRVTSIYSNGFKMEYIDGKDIVKIMISEPERLESIADSILKLIDWEFKHSVKRPLFIKPLVKKLSKACPEELRCYAISEAKKLRFKFIPVGRNHGDLTCANMIFTDSSIYLIDFLKTFYRTPYQDIAKLLQEVDLHWAELMSNYDTESNAIKQGYDYLNYRIQEHLKEHYSKHRQAIRLFHFVCLCRLFPYAKKGGEIYDLIRYRCLEMIDDETGF